MGKITTDMVRIFNDRLATRGSTWRIVEREYENAGFELQIHVEPANPEMAPMLVDHLKYTNGSDLDQEITFAVEKTVKLTQKHSLVETTKMGVSATFEYKIFEIVNTKLTFNLEYNRQSSEETTQEETFLIRFTQPVKIPKRTRITMQTIIQVQKVKDLPFELHVLLRDGGFAVIPKDLGPVYRYWNGTDHLYTADYNEIGEGRFGYVKEGIGFYISTSQLPGMVPFYRYMNGTDHFYTADYNEMGEGQFGYVKEGIAGYVYTSQQPGTTPLYRYWNGTDHFYSADYNEMGHGRDGWELEGTAAFVHAPGFNDPGLTRNVRDLFPNNDDRLFVFHGHYRGETTDRNTDVLLVSEPVIVAPLRLEGEQAIERAPDSELPGIRVLSNEPHSITVPAGTPVDLTVGRKKRRHV